MTIQVEEDKYFESNRKQPLLVLLIMDGTP